MAENSIMMGEVKQEAGSEEEREEEDGARHKCFSRSRYLAIKDVISGEREDKDVGGIDLDKFGSIISELDDLHQFVQKPREQVVDAEALLDVANALVTFVRSQTNGLTPSDFVAAVLAKFGSANRRVTDKSFWAKIGNGPMDTQPKIRKTAVRRKRRGNFIQPREPDETPQSDTDKNMVTMFDILRMNRRVELENLVLNRVSFAQTVENIFTLSFLVKDGRAEITVDDNGHHLVAPRNAPTATAVASGRAPYSHFVFRFDSKDWKLMKDTVPLGEELMHHRSNSGSRITSQSDQTHNNINSRAGPAPAPAPMRQLNHYAAGLIKQEEELMVDDTPPPPQRDSSSLDERTPRSRKRRLGLSSWLL